MSYISQQFAWIDRNLWREASPSPVRKAKGESAWADLIDKLAAQFEAPVAAAFVKVCADLADAADVEALAAAIAQGDPAKIDAILNITEATYLPLYDPLRAAAMAAGAAAAGQFGPRIMAAAAAKGGAVAPRAAPAMQAKFSFNLLNPHTEATLRSYGMGLIKQITEETREAIKTQVRQHVTNGLGPADTARAIKKVVGFGLTAQQTQAVANFRAELESGSKAALDRALRDHRFDPTIKKAIDGKIKLTPAQIDKMVGAYLQRMLAWRATLIARTESLRAANMGAHLAMVQAVGDGHLPEDAIVKSWIIAHDERVCPQCKPIPKMNPAGIALRATFSTPLGPIVIPPAHILCRCCCTYTMPSLLPGG